MKNFTLFALFVFFSFNSFSQTELISNSSISSGSYWSFSGSSYLFCSSGGYYSYNSSPCYGALPVTSSGQKGDNLSGYFSQQVYIPSNTSSATISFYTYITTDEVTTSSPYDKLVMTISDGTNTDNLTYSNLDKSTSYTYKSATITGIAKYLGKTVTVKFQATNDGGKPTVFRVDDVSLLATTSGKPDLIIEQYPTLSSSTVQAGNNTTVYFNVINQGNAKASSTTTSIHISPKYFFDNQAIWVADYSTPSLNANQSTGTVSKTITIPSGTSPGNYYILVSADGLVAIDESNKNNQTTYVAITVTSAQQYGSLNVTLSPQDAINKGAQWRVDGGSWKSSGSTVSSLAVGSHTVEYSSATGYNTPSNKQINISVNNTTNDYQSYTSNAEPKISTNLSTLDFTNICVSTTKDFTITNTGNADLIVQPITDISNYSADLNNQIILKSNESQAVYVNFSPSGTGTYNGVLKINSNATNQPQLIITLNGSCDLNSNLSIAGSVNPKSAFVGDKYSWEANITGKAGPNLTVNIEITNPVTKEIQTFPMIKNSQTNFTYSTNLTAIGNYIYRFQINQTGTYSQYYQEPITSVQPPIDDYPRKSWFNPDCDKSEKYDPWGFESNQCVSWLAWKVNQAFGVTSTTLPIKQYPFYNTMQGGHFGNASNWKSNAEIYIKKFPVNQTPAIGSIAWFGKGEAGASSSGHVAYVNDYNSSNNKLTITDYNFVTCEFDSRTVDLSKPNAAGNRTPSWFIHVEGGKGEGDTSISKINNNIVLGSSTIYPNPSNGNFYIDLFYYESNVVNVLLIDYLGKTVYEEDWRLSSGENSLKFNLENIPNGLYMVVLKNQNEVFQKRILIQH